MKNIHIENSYNTWDISDIRKQIDKKCYEEYISFSPVMKLNRTYESMYIEWWLHNIGYHITKPFCFIEPIKKINLRCKDVDLQEHP